MQKTKELVDDIVAKQKVKEAEKAPKVLRNAKAQRMAAKVQLMKLKMKSDGTLQLPQEERIYFKVELVFCVYLFSVTDIDSKIAFTPRYYFQKLTKLESAILSSPNLGQSEK